MLDRISIENFKSIKTLDLKLDRLNLLIGSNGVGKSNFLSFFKLVQNIYEQRLEKYSMQVGAENLLHYGSKTSDYISGNLHFGLNGYEFSLLPNDKSGLFIEREDSSYESGGKYSPTSWNSNLPESHIKDSKGYRDSYLRDYLSGIKIYHFHDTSPNAPLRIEATIQDNHYLKGDGSNIAAFLYFLSKKYPKSFNRIENTVRSVAPFFGRFNLSPDRLDETRIRLEWLDSSGSDKYFNASHLSDGSLRFIALATLLLQPRLPSLIIIDEPELGLHPVAINKLSAMIQVASKKSQMIISTQSVGLLNNFEAEQIITVDKEGSQSRFQRLSVKDLATWLEDYSIGELWSKSVIKGQP